MAVRHNKTAPGNLAWRREQYGQCRIFSLFERLSNAAHQFWTSRIGTADDCRSSPALLQRPGETRSARKEPMGFEA
jgi:hypothetical protein